MTKKEEALAKKAARLEAERQRTREMQAYERNVTADLEGTLGRNVLICGIDEAGRGPFAGPVVAGAVILNLHDPEKEILYLNDSKKLSEKKREMLYREILEKADAVGIGYAGSQLIDRINILQATFHAMRMAIMNLTNVSHLTTEEADEGETKKENLTEEEQKDSVHKLVQKLIRYELPKACDMETEGSAKEQPALIPDFILADAVHIPGIEIPQEGIVKGDAKSVSIAAGSIIAKVTRDHIMYEYDRQYPEYGFASHKGYGTKAHIAAIREHGKLPIHRNSFIHF